MDSDKGYTTRRIGSLGARYSNDFTVALFEDLESLQTSFSQTKIDVLLAAPNLVPEGTVLAGVCQLIYLSDAMEIETIYGSPAICGYQGVEAIVTDVRLKYSEQRKEPRTAAAPREEFYFRVTTDYKSIHTDEKL